MVPRGAYSTVPSFLERKSYYWMMTTVQIIYFPTAAPPGPVQSSNGRPASIPLWAPSFLASATVFCLFLLRGLALGGGAATTSVADCDGSHRVTGWGRKESDGQTECPDALARKELFPEPKGGH